jgi:maltooligosyltrehalose trehalohydrolase
MQGLFASSRRGASLVEGGVAFTLWAPLPKEVRLRMHSGKRAGTHAMFANNEGLWGVMLEEVVPGDRYTFVCDGQEHADPCSRFQPEGVHGPSEVVDPARLFSSDARFEAPSLRDLAIYELHVGAFTPEGTLSAAARQLPALRDLGFNCVQLMPVAECGGAPSWGYDAVQWYAVQASYGGPPALAAFVEAAHALGMAVILDTSYDHVGSAGATLADLGPYLTGRRDPSLGLSINHEGPGADPVREHALEAALAWFTDYRVDGLKLTGSRGATEFGPRQLWRELSERVSKLGSELGRELLLIGESDRNEVRLFQPLAEGGFGLGAMWSDDFHHALNALLAPKREGWLVDFGSVDHLRRALAQGFAYEGEWSRHRGGPRGTFARREPVERFVIFSQNHEHLGRSATGQRLGIVAGSQAERLALAMTVFAPGTPLVFMGQEYGERAPFLHFGGDDGVAAAFERSKLDLSQRDGPGHRGMLELTKDVLALRAKHETLRQSDRHKVEVEIDQRRRLLCLRRGEEGQRLLFLCSFSKEPQTWERYVPEARWELLLDCADARYEGTGKSTERLHGGFSSHRLEPLAGRIFREAP